MATNLGNNSVPQGTGFENMKATGLAEAGRWCCKRPGEAIHDGAASIAVKTSGFKVVMGTDKALYHAAESEFLKKCRDSLMKVQFLLEWRLHLIGDIKIMAWPPRTVADMK